MRRATAPSSSATACTVVTLARVFSVASPTRLTSSAVSMRALGGDLDAARDLLRRRALLGHRRRDRAADRADVADGALDRADRLDRALRGVLHAGDLRGDVLGRLGGLAGQRLDLAGHHREAAAGLAGAGGLDGGVEREQIGLLGDVGDQATTSPMRLAASSSSLTAALVRSASSTAFSAMAFDCATWRSISMTDAASSSAAEAMSRTLLDASADAVVAPCGALRGAVGGLGELRSTRRASGRRSRRARRCCVSTYGGEAARSRPTICSWRCARASASSTHRVVELLVVLHGVLEHGDRARQRADLVAARAVGNRDGGALGDLLGDARDLRQRPRHGAPDDERADRRQQDRERAEQRHDPGGASRCR